MKKKIKILLMSLLAPVLVVASVVGTVAYLTDAESAVNTFTVGKVDIKLDEAEVGDDGKALTGDNAARVQGNNYRMIPGAVYDKDPTVTVLKGSEKSYVRIMVTLNKMDVIKAALGTDFLPQNYVEGWDQTKWPCVNIINNNDNTVTYEFRYYEKVGSYTSDADTVLDPLFKKIKIPGTLTGDQVEDLKDFNISIVGHAIQAAGFADADAAWAAFDDQIAAEKQQNAPQNP